MDDITVFECTEEKYNMGNPYQILCRKAGLKLNRDKHESEDAERSLLISLGVKLKQDSRKGQEIPSCKRGPGDIICIAKCPIRFIPDFLQRTLNRRTVIKKLFIWNEVHQREFEDLKELLLLIGDSREYLCRCKHRRS